MSADRPAVVTQRAGQVHVARLAGEIDHATAPQVRDDLSKSTAEAVAIVVDLTDVTYLDSAGVRVLDELARAYTERRVPLRIAAPPQGPARMVLELCAFPAELLSPDVAVALAALATAQG